MFCQWYIVLARHFYVNGSEGLNDAKGSKEAHRVSGFPQAGSADIRGLVTDIFSIHRGLILDLRSSALKVSDTLLSPSRFKGWPLPLLAPVRFIQTVLDFIGIDSCSDFFLGHLGGVRRWAMPGVFEAL